MKLTDKAETEFKAYYVDKYQEGGYRQYAWFKDLPEAFMWGVYQDWADSLGFDVTTPSSIEQDEYWFSIWQQDEQYEHLNDEYFKTREEARNAAIEKLNELINEK